MILGVLALSNMHIFMSHIHFKPTLSFKNTVRGPTFRDLSKKKELLTEYFLEEELSIKVLKIDSS